METLDQAQKLGEFMFEAGMIKSVNEGHSVLFRKDDQFFRFEEDAMKLTF